MHMREIILKGKELQMTEKLKCGRTLRIREIMAEVMKKRDSR